MHEILQLVLRSNDLGLTHWFVTQVRKRDERKAVERIVGELIAD